VKLLVHSAPATLEQHRHPNLGVLSSPRRYYTDVDGWDWAADNDAYSAWDADRYRAMLARIHRLPGCLFVTAPDVVGDATRTLQSFEAWHDELAAAEVPIALVAQDGVTPDSIPWERIRALFIGGTDMFKMGPDAATVAREAKRRGLWLHMGRVNGHRRLRYAKAIGCDSVDGTSLSWFKDRWLRDFLDHAAQPRQEILS
jgi:hypothetical protein